MTIPVIEFQYPPAIDPQTIRRNLSRLLSLEELKDAVSEGMIRRLAERHRTYASLTPVLPVPGLALTNEIRSWCELYLPVKDILAALDRLLVISLKYPVPEESLAFKRSCSWPDLLRQLRPLVEDSDPSALLRQLMRDPEFRVRFLFHLFLPERHGGSFYRYPRQEAFLKDWLKHNRKRLSRQIRFHDAACGTGEGTYRLARVLQEEGFDHSYFEASGSTIDPLELFSAAHSYFPHDPQRQKAYRTEIRPLFSSGAIRSIFFFRDDIRKPRSSRRQAYDVVLCNGLLGGPFIHDEPELRAVIENLAAMLAPGGLLLAAETFHGGWKKKVPVSLLRKIFTDSGLAVTGAGEGLAAYRPSP